MVELFLKAARAGASFGFSDFSNPGERQTHGHPPEHAHNQGRVGLAHPALILGHRHIQCLMQAALNNPVCAFENKKTHRIELIQRQAADQIDDLGAFLSIAPDSPSELGNGAGSGKARLFGRYFAAIKHADFMASPIVFPRQGMGLCRR